MTFEAESVIGGRLRLVRKIRDGGMGSIWAATRLADGVEVAVKLMSHALAREPEIVERFRREAAAASMIKHPNVVTILDHGVCDDGSPFIAMELLAGEDLGARIQRLGPLPLPEIADIVTLVASALGRAHQLGVIHRDVKPENIFITGDEGGTVKVLDFGVAKADRKHDYTLTGSGSMIGTPLYMSPEQILGAQAADAHCDLWALACVAYRAVTGRPPFFGRTFGALCVAIDKGEFEAPSAFRAEVPASLDAFFRRAFARDVGHRFGSARELADAFARAIGRDGAFSNATGDAASLYTPIHLETFTSDAVAPRRRWLAITGCILGGGALAAIVAVVAFGKKAPPIAATPVAKIEAPIASVSAVASIVAPLPSPTTSAPIASASATAIAPRSPPIAHAPTTPAHAATSHGGRKDRGF